MPVVVLPYGTGLQRSDGVMVRLPVSFEDLRNVFLYEGKAEIRKGMTQTSVLVNDDPIDIDQVVGLEALRSQQAALAVGYQTATEELWLNILAIDGTNPSAVGLLADVSVLNNGWLYAVPSLVMAESDSKMLIAHDEPNLGGRVPTKVYDPFGITISTLQADLDGEGDADVLFRGITRHLTYIVGWGYGNATDPNRPDVLRISNSGDPVTFQDFAFFEVGQRAERITVCRTAGTSLIVFKETETYELFGYSPDTFGMRPVDVLFGCVGHRLAVSVGNQVFFWSNQGPRVITGNQASTDIATPLDIEGPDPTTLVAESDVHDAFAQYDAKSRVVLFVWGRRVYALSIRNPSKPRWSYYELGETAQVGAQLFTTESGSGGVAPTGYPDITLGSAVPKVGEESIAATLTWDNIGDTAAAVIQIYLSEDAGATYVLKKSVASSGGAGQTTDIEGLTPNTPYKLSLRAFRGASGTTPAVVPGIVDWTGNAGDADNWDSAAFRGQATFVTDEAVPLPVFRSGENNGVWEVISGAASRITVEWVIPVGAEGLEIEIERARADEGNTGTQALAGGVGPPDSGGKQAFGGFVALATVAAGTTSYEDADFANNAQWNRYRFRFVGAVAFSPSLDCWGGPDAPGDDWNANMDGDSVFITLDWINANAPGRTLCPGPTAAPANHYTLAYTNNMDVTPASDDWMTGTAGERENPFITAGGVSVLGGVPAPEETDTVRVGLRHEVTCFGTIYTSYWARVTGTPDYREGLIGDKE